jgi:group I intron endonuclease
MMKSGIYRITCTANGKIYIGSAISLKVRRQHHWNRLKAKAHGNRHLQNAWNKHGPDAFTWDVIEFVATEQLIDREQHFIDQFDSCNPRLGFNISPTAGSCLGCKHTDEGKARKSAALKGKKKSPEAVEKVRLALLGKPGKPWTEETRAKACAAMKGVKRSPEACQRMREARLARPKRTLTEEQKAKIAAANRGRTGSDKQRAAATKANQTRVWTEEARRKIGEANRGRIVSDDTRAKMSATRKGKKLKPLTEEHKRRMSEARRGKPISKEHLAKMVAATKGKKQTSEFIEKRAAANRGKKRSPEVCAKFSEARRLDHHRRKAEAARLKAEQRAQATFLRTGIRPTVIENPKQETQGKLFDS